MVVQIQMLKIKRQYQRDMLAHTSKQAMRDFAWFPSYKSEGALIVEKRI
jgi:hypothetical protein